MRRFQFPIKAANRDLLARVLNRKNSSSSQAQWTNGLNKTTNISEGKIRMHNSCVATCFCLSTIFTGTDDPKMLSYITTRHLPGGEGGGE